MNGYFSALDHNSLADEFNELCNAFDLDSYIAQTKEQDNDENFKMLSDFVTCVCALPVALTDTDWDASQTYLDKALLFIQNIPNKTLLENLFSTAFVVRLEELVRQGISYMQVNNLWKVTILNENANDARKFAQSVLDSPNEEFSANGTFDLADFALALGTIESGWVFDEKYNSERKQVIGSGNVRVRYVKEGWAVVVDVENPVSDAIGYSLVVSAIKTWK